MPKVKLSDMEMYYEVDDFTDPWTSPEVVLMHHGVTRTSRFWYAWVPELARKFRVIRVDARGHGQSTVPPPGYPWRFDQLVEDLREFLQALGIPRVHLVAEMSGTLVGLSLAARYPELVRSLSLCSTAIMYRRPEPGSPEAALAETGEVIRRMGVRKWFEATHSSRFDTATTDPRLVQWYTEGVSQVPEHVQAGLVDSRRIEEVVAELPRVQAPTLILAPGIDAPAKGERSPHRLIPRCELRVFPGRRRAFFFTEAEMCARAVLGFISRL